MIQLRPFSKDDFDLLLDLANQAVPFAPQENMDWLEARRLMKLKPYGATS